MCNFEIKHSKKLTMAASLCGRQPPPIVIKIGMYNASQLAGIKVV